VAHCIPFVCLSAGEAVAGAGRARCCREHRRRQLSPRLPLPPTPGPGALVWKRVSQIEVISSAPTPAGSPTPPGSRAEAALSIPCGQEVAVRGPARPLWASVSPPSAGGDSIRTLSVTSFLVPVPSSVRLGLRQAGSGHVGPLPRPCSPSPSLTPATPRLGPLASRPPRVPWGPALTKLGLRAPVWGP
jgi:hypothetical protein